MIKNNSVRVIGPRDDYHGPFIDVTSHSKTQFRDLSPFLLKDIPLYNGMTAANMENAWQYSKVYRQFSDADGSPTESYFEWAKRGWAKTFANRYPMGKGATPLYSYWNGNRFGYVESRRNIYIPLYAQAAVQTEAFQQLKNLYQSGAEIILWDFDGYDYLKLGMELKNVLLCEIRKMGHAFVLAMMLEGLIDEPTWQFVG